MTNRLSRAITNLLLTTGLLVTSCTSPLSRSASPDDPESEPIVNGAPLTSHAPNPVLIGGDVTAEKQKTVRLGNTKLPRWGWADVPVDMVRKAETRLKPPASSWDVSHHWHEEGNTFKVLLLHDDNGTPCLFTCTQDEWMLMGGEQGLKRISLMQQERLQALPRLSAVELYRLCGSIAYLYARPDRYELQANERYPEHWLRGGEVKDLSVLKKYCVDPKVVQEGDEYIITCYAITRKGSLEHWKTRVRRQDGRSEIVDISIREVMKKGSFSWGLVP